MARGSQHPERKPRSDPLRHRPDAKWPPLLPFKDKEETFPRWSTILKLVYNSVARLFHEPAGIVMGSSILLLMVWGLHGRVELLGRFLEGWEWPQGGPGSDPSQRTRFIPAIPWDHELISFALGFVLLVLIPILLIKFLFKRKLSEFGLGLPYPDRWGIVVHSTLLLAIFAAVAVTTSLTSPEMRMEYPVFHDRELLSGSLGCFLLYELTYLLFFITIEFVFRGFLLFGLYHAKDGNGPGDVRGVGGPLVFGYQAILISMLSYTAWHFGKPTEEVFGTLLWGVATGAIALSCGTIWHIVIIHWLMNVILDWNLIHT